MPKQSKNKAKSHAKYQTKTKPKVQPKASGITTKKWYWIMLASVMVLVFSVVGYIMGLGLTDIAILVFTIALLIGLVGYIRITPSVLSVSKRATFLFLGTSVIGFGVWAAIILVAMNTGSIERLFPNLFFLIFSFIIAMILGAFAGELLGKNGRVQRFFFKPENAI